MITSPSLLRRVDHSAIRVNQLFTVLSLVLAFVFNSPLLAGITGLIMLVSALVPPLGLFTRFYRHVLRPAGVIAPRVELDNPEPHRFAQLVGALVVLSGTLALLGGAAVPGWALIAVVIVLANLNLWAGWCAGCTMYYWLNRWGVPGFDHAPVESAR